MADVWDKPPSQEELDAARLRALADRNNGAGLPVHQEGHMVAPPTREELIRAGVLQRKYPTSTAAIHGAREAGSLGFADELGALGQAEMQVAPWLFPNVSKAAGDALGPLGNPGVRDANGAPLSPLDIYRQARDSNRTEERDIRQDNPAVYKGAEMATSMLMPLPGSSSILGATKVGAGLGALNALGNSEADLTEPGEQNLRRSGADMAFGAAGGGAGGLTGGIVASKLPALLRFMRTKLEDAGVAQGRRALLNGADSLSNKTQVSDDAVREALSSGAILPFGTTQGASKRLDALREQYGQTYGALLEELEKAGVPGANVHEVADRLLNRAAETELTTGANKAVPRAFYREAQNVENVSNGKVNLLLTQAEKIKRDLQAAASSEYRKMGGSKPLGEAKKEIASVYRKANEDAVEQAGQAAPDGSEVRTLADAFVPVKSRMGRIIEAGDAAERGATRTSNRSAIGLPEKIAMAGGIATGHPGQALSAVAGGGLTRALFNRGASTAAAGSYWSSRAAKALADAAARNPSLTRGVATMLGSGLGREEVSQAQRAADGLSDEERGKLATWLSMLRGE